MVLTRQALSEYDARIQRLGDAAYDTVYRRVTQFMKRFPGASVERVRDFTIESVAYAVSVYGDAASTCAADLYDEMAEASGAKLPPAALDTTDVSGFIDKEVRYQAGKLTAGKVEEFAGAVAAKATDQVSRRANETMRRNAKRDGLRYARVPMGGETCTFCIMLASRGFVYKSAKTAGEGNHFHAHCRCKVVPQFDKRGRETRVEGYDPDELLDRWRKFEQIDASTDLTVRQRATAKRLISDGVSPDVQDAMSRAASGPIAASPVFLNKSSELYRRMRRVEPLEGYYDVMGHSDGRALIYGDLNDIDDEPGTALTMAELKAAITSDPSYTGGPIRIVACDAGGQPDCLAQRLADEMGVEVLAPTTTVYVDYDGKMTLAASDDEYDDIVEGKIKETGKWAKFYPGGRDE